MFGKVENSAGQWRKQAAERLRRKTHKTQHTSAAVEQQEVVKIKQNTEPNRERSPWQK